eukprot:4844087-Pyramimonas_sp.AAC.1
MRLKARHVGSRPLSVTPDGALMGPSRVVLEASWAICPVRNPWRGLSGAEFGPIGLESAPPPSCQ